MFSFQKSHKWALFYAKLLAEIIMFIVIQGKEKKKHTA